MTQPALSDASNERDDGLAAERTELAWSRSGLALLGAFAVLARHAWDGTARDQIVTVTLLGVAGLGWSIVVIGGRLHHGTRQPVSAPRLPTRFLALSLATVAVGLAGLVAAFTER